MALFPAMITGLYFLLYPVICLVHCSAVLLQLFLAPFVYLGLGVFQIVLLPWRLLVKFEALFQFLIMALLTGVTAGLILHHISTFLVELLHLSSESKTLRRTKGDRRTVATPTISPRSKELVSLSDRKVHTDRLLLCRGKQ